VAVREKVTHSTCGNARSRESRSDYTGLRMGAALPRMLKGDHKKATLAWLCGAQLGDVLSMVGEGDARTFLSPTFNSL
jgi:hypothetical protein